MHFNFFSQQSMAAGIPVIDFSKFPGQFPDLLKACEEWGCFRLINHPMSPELLPEMKSVVRNMLDLPPEIKRRNSDAIVGSGYMAPSAQNPLYEALGLYQANSETAIDDFCTKFQATPQQREIFHSYSRELHELALNIGNKIAESLELGSDLFNDWPTQFRISKYSFSKETIGKYGVQIHTDCCFLTILQDDDCVNGLEMMDKRGEFVAVDPLPNSFLVNLGDIAKAWSNGRFQNVKHRVLCKQGTPRVSIAFFMHGPPEGVAVEAPAELVDVHHPRLYKPFTYEEYRRNWFTTSKNGDALLLYGAATH